MDHSPRKSDRRRWVAAAAWLFLLHVAAPVPARACDMCSVYNAADLRDSLTGLRVGVAEQFTEFSNLRRDGDRVDNPNNERLRSSITQFLVSYQPRAEWGVQLSLPVITRDYHRATARGVENGDETGIGDLALSLRYRPFLYQFNGGNIRLALLGGVTVPSGDSDRLGEESPSASQTHGSWAKRKPRHNPAGVESGVHGHDLALGSGSVDGLFGGDVLAVWNKAFCVASIQYRLRNPGAFGYEYADDLGATIAPGYFVLTRGGVSLAVKGHVTAETKGKDRASTGIENDTGFTALYAGPGLELAWRTNLDVEVSADLPAIRNNTGLQIVPEYRLRGALVWHF